MSDSPFEHVDGTAPLVYWPYCHPQSPLKVTLLYSGVMVLNCTECGQECGRFKAEEFVLNEWKCDCGFRMSTRTMDQDLNVGGPVDNEAPLCMKDGKTMTPLTWRESALELSNIGEGFLKRLTALENAWPEGFSMPVEWEEIDV